jgi:hypothetical protein
VGALPVSAQTAVDTGCPRPYYDFVNQYLIPPYGFMQQKVSLDGKYLAYVLNQSNGVFLLDLHTLEQKAIYCYGNLPGEKKRDDVTFSPVSWCPYDSDLFAVNGGSEIDTGGGKYFGVENIYTYRISTGECNRITPDIFPYGGNVGLYGDNRNDDWSHLASPGNDTFLIAYTIPDRVHNEDSIFIGYYIPQSQKLIPKKKLTSSGLVDSLVVFAQSKDFTHMIWAYVDLNNQQGHILQPYYLDTTIIEFPQPIYGMGKSSFSPNSKLFAITIARHPNLYPADTEWDQVWIYETKNPKKPISMINFQRSFCMYSFWGIWPEFITDSTLAVSMHKDSALFSHIYEITIDGKMVRQLTSPFQPSLVSERSNDYLNSLTTSPNPFTAKITLKFTLNRMAYTTIAIYDELGRLVWGDGRGSSLEAGLHTVHIDGKDLPHGTLYARISTGFGEVKTVKLVHE